MWNRGAGVGHLKSAWQMWHHPVQGGAAATDKHHNFKLSYKLVFLKNETVKAVYFCNSYAMQLVGPFHVLTDFVCLCLSLVINCLGWKHKFLILCLYLSSILV